jgi:cobaltochelatase CobN
LERLSGRGFAHLLEDLDAYLCDLGRAQIRGGLHVFGAPPEGQALVDLLFAILRSPNGNVPSLIDAVTEPAESSPPYCATLRECGRSRCRRLCRNGRRSRHRGTGSDRRR